MSRSAPKKPPYANEAEQGLLTNVVTDNLLARDCRLVARHPEWFSAGWRPIAEAVFSLIGRDLSADAGSVIDELELRGDLESLGGKAEVWAKLSSESITSRATRTYAEQIRQAAHDRRAFDYAQKIAAAAFTDPDTLEELLQRRTKDLAQFAEEPADTLRYRLMSANETELLEPSVGILGDLLFEDSIAVLYAKSGRWKSFLALAMAFAIATDAILFSRRARPGAVVYIAAEAARNIGKRITAARIQHGIPADTPIRLYVLGKAVNLLDAAGVVQLIREIQEQLDEPPALVIIDTLARSMPGGDENATKDMNVVYDAATAIRTAWGCCVLIVHHEGKESTRGARGNSAIFANADTVLRVTGQENKTAILPGDVLQLECEKAKEDAPFEPIRFTADVKRWSTSNGQFRTSLIIMPSDQPIVTSEPLTRSQQRILDILAASPGGLSYAGWKERCQPCAESTFTDARKTLVDRRFVRVGPEPNLYRAIAPHSGEQNSHNARNQAAAPELRNYSETTPDVAVTPTLRITPVPLGTPEHPEQRPGVTDFGPGFAS